MGNELDDRLIYQGRQILVGSCFNDSQNVIFNFICYGSGIQKYEPAVQSWRALLNLTWQEIKMCMRTMHVW